MNTTGNTDTPQNDLVWSPRPDRQVAVDDLEWGCVIRGEDGGHTTVDEADDDNCYFSEFGTRRLEGSDQLVTVVADDDIMVSSLDMRGRPEVELLRLVGEKPFSNHRWHFYINQLFLWEVITTMSDWDALVAKAQTTKTGRMTLARFHRPLSEARQAVESGLERHTSKNADLGVDRRVYRVNW